MAKKTNADYKAAQYARKKARQEAMGEKDLILPVTVGVQSLIDDLIERHGFGDWRELLITMVRVAHADSVLGHKLTQLPKSGFVPTDAQVARLQSVGATGCSGCDDLECSFCFGGD